MVSRVVVSWEIPPYFIEARLRINTTEYLKILTEVLMDPKTL